ncbi:MAG: DUF58 domain-containing protein [Magnetococcus sp. WYHC-3]
MSPADPRLRAIAGDLIGLRHAARRLSLAPHRVRSPLSGSRLSPFRGRGLEFDESRRYQPGDDTLAMDWRVTARTGQPHVKLFRQERERPVLLWIDMRRAMMFASRGALKAVQAARAAAQLAWAARARGDRVGALLFHDRGHLLLRPRGGDRGVTGLIQALCDFPDWEGPIGFDITPPPLEQELMRLRRVARPGTLVFLISDFRGLEDNAAAHFARLTDHCDVVALFVQDPLEEHPPPPGRYPFSDGRRRLEWRGGAAQEYSRSFCQRRDRAAALCRAWRVPLFPLDTPVTVEEQLARHLGDTR